MSRRRGEFEHRTSIFEGAFRAWSHMGGLDPADLATKSTADLDPILHPIQNDPRLLLQKEKDRRKNAKSDNNGNDNNDTNKNSAAANNSSNDNADNNNSNENKKPKVAREYAYEPLPRTGLVHPFVQAVLSPWLGPDADQDAIQLGLTTLRTWWQHRRKGESGSAITALGTEKMTGVVEGYTRHFFNLAHCLVMNDGEQPPRTLGGKMKEYAKKNGGQGIGNFNANGDGYNKGRKRSRDGGSSGGNSVEEALAFGQNNFGAASAVHNAMMNNFGGVNLMGNGDTLNIGGGGGGGLLDRLQASQRRLLAAEGGVSSIMPQQPFGAGSNTNTALPNNTTTASNKGITPTTLPPFEMKGRCIPGNIDLPGLVKRVNAAATQLAHRGGGAGLSQNPSNLPTTFTPNVDPSKYGDPNIMPVVLISQQNDIQILMTVNGITCAHCVKIIETVLKGPPGRNTGSPIEGLVDAAADQELDILLIKIKSIQEARRIAYEASRNLMMVGYTAQAESVDIQAIGKSGGGGGNNNGKEEMSLSTMYRVFETVPEVNPSIGNVLDWKVECECPENNVMRANCRRHQQMSSSIIESFYKAKQVVSELIAGCGKKNGMPCAAGSHCFCKSQTDPTLPQTSQVYPANDTAAAVLSSSMGNSSAAEDTMPIRDGPGRPAGRMSMRMSLGGMLGRHSLTSNTTFGRAMSGLSALSIDWENMDDFDINVDHSEGINNDIVNQQKEQQERGEGSSSTIDSKVEQQVLDAEEGYGPIQRVGPRTARRSSLRNPQMNAFVNANMNVHFDM